MWTAACLVMAAAFSCAAQDTPATYPVKGVVLDSVSRQPIARALVDANADAALTDNEGRFELNLPPGEAEISLRRPGYGARGRGVSHAVKVGANMPDLAFTLSPEAMISGHVTLSTGDEADGIRIVAYRKRVVNGHQTWTVQNTVTTNSEGTFRLADLEAPGSYLLYTIPAHDRTGPIAPGAISYGYPSEYYPGVADFSGAGVLTLSPGQQAEADFTLTRQPFYPVSISTAERQQGRGAGVTIHDSSGRTLEVGVRWNSERGTTQVNLPNGRYYAEARSGGEYGRVEFNVAGGPVSGLTMALVPLHPVAVQIRKDFTTSDSNNGGLSPASVPQILEDAGLIVGLAPADSFNNDRGNSGLRHPEGSSDSSLFELENVLPGRYWLEIRPFNNYYVSSVTSGGVDLAREPLVAGPGSTVAPIEITLRNDAGKISGQTNSPSTAASGAESPEASVAHVYAIPLFPTTSPVQEVVVQSSSQFSMANLPPGSYHVIALDEPEEIDPSDAQELAKYTGKGQTVTVEANGTANVQLDVIRASDGGSEP